MLEYKVDGCAVREKTARLRALRLAKEAGDNVAKLNKKPISSKTAQKLRIRKKQIKPLLTARAPRFQRLDSAARSPFPQRQPPQQIPSHGATEPPRSHQPSKIRGVDLSRAHAGRAASSNANRGRSLRLKLHVWIAQVKKLLNLTDKHVGSRVRMRSAHARPEPVRTRHCARRDIPASAKIRKERCRISASRLHHISNVLQVPIPFFFEGLPRHSGASERTTDAPFKSYVSDFLATSGGISLSRPSHKSKNRSSGVASFG